jgi:hypothetical protein
MAAAQNQTDVLSRVRREQRMHRKPSRYSGLRIVLAATGITIAILLFAFGAIGMLLMARNPQEPLASKFDPAPPVAQQVEMPPVTPQPEIATSTHEKTPEPDDTDKRAVKTLRVIAPPAPPAAEQSEAVVQQQVPQTDPETTATVPPAQVQEPQEEPKPVVKHRPRVQQQRVYRPAQKQERQSDNPLFQLFGIKQYR